MCPVCAAGATRMAAAASPALSVVTSEWGASPLAAPKNVPMLFMVSAWPLQARRHGVLQKNQDHNNTHNPAWVAPPT